MTHRTQSRANRPDPRITRSEAELAERWGISRRTLQRWRRDGEGPPFLRLGRRVFYRLTDIERFEEAARAGCAS